MENFIITAVYCCFNLFYNWSFDFLFLMRKNYFTQYKIRKTNSSHSLTGSSYFNLIFNLFINSTISMIVGILFLEILPTHINPDDFIEKSYYVMFIKILKSFIISNLHFISLIEFYILNLYINIFIMSIINMKNQMLYQLIIHIQLNFYLALYQL